MFICMFCYYNWSVNRTTETTTIRVSKKTAETLENLREKLGAQSLDEAIQTLVKKQRKAILEKSFGADRGSNLNPLRRQIAVKIVIDSYAWIEHFLGAKKAAK